MLCVEKTYDLPAAVPSRACQCKTIFDEHSERLGCESYVLQLLLVSHPSEDSLVLPRASVGALEVAFLGGRKCGREHSQNIWGPVEP